MTTSADQVPRDRSDAVAASPSRINVAVSPPMLDAIDRVIRDEDVTLTEAVRRLIGYGDFVYDVARDPGSRLVVRDPNGRECEVVVT